MFSRVIIPLCMFSRFIQIMSIFIIAGISPLPASANNDAPDYAIGILTPPSIDGDVLYFAGWGGKLYAFDEAKNQARWEVSLNPLPSELDPKLLPAPPPYLAGSYILLHIGRQLWGISKVDGRSVWCVDNLMPASNYYVRRTGSPLPGFFVYDKGAAASVFTAEQTEDAWFIRNRQIGNGDLNWESALPGKPGAFWFDNDILWIVSVLPVRNGESLSYTGPAVLKRFDPSTGEEIWTSTAAEFASFCSALRTDGRIFIVEKVRSEFQIRAFIEDSGEMKRSISYEAGDFIEAFKSADKIVLLHHYGEPDQNLLRLSIYFSTLNAIRFQTIRKSRDDSLFSRPAIDGNLFLYGGAAYELYNGNPVWRKDEQMVMVDWAADSERIYTLLSNGDLITFDRLTGVEIQRIPVAILPPREFISSTSLDLIDERVFVSTPLGEIFRIDTFTGTKHPGVIRVPSSMTVDKKGDFTPTLPEQKSGIPRFLIWLALTIVVLGASVLILRLARNKH